MNSKRVVVLIVVLVSALLIFASAVSAQANSATYSTHFDVQPTGFGSISVNVQPTGFGGVCVNVQPSGFDN